MFKWTSEEVKGDWYHYWFCDKCKNYTIVTSMLWPLDRCCPSCGDSKDEFGDGWCEGVKRKVWTAHILWFFFIPIYYYRDYKKSEVKL